ncbi:MAG: hypothetical protein ACKOBW_18325 [Planctomycetota bacterium]
MNVQLARLVGLTASLLLCSAAAAQQPAYRDASYRATRYYRPAVTSQGPAARFQTVGHGHGGCADCGGGGPAYEVDMGYGGPDCGGCGGCGRCCRLGILPAVANGVGAVADLVGGTLDFIFCKPHNACCAPRARACYRPACERRWCPSCGDGAMSGGCSSCGGEFEGSFESPMPGVPVEETPVAPKPAPAQARSYRVPGPTYQSYQSYNRMPTYQQGARSVPAANKARPTAAQVSNIEEIQTTASSSPRELVVPAGHATRLSNEVESPKSRPASSNSAASSAPKSATGRSLPVNPLRP